MTAISGSNAHYSGVVRRALFLSAAFLGSLVSAQSQTGQNALPEGAGKQIAQTACVQCHELGRLTRPNGHTPEEWQDVVKRMVWYGSSLTAEQIAVPT